MADRSYKLTLSLSDGSTINAGTITAPQGPNGANGVTFTPSVSAAGVLSWTNNGGLTNPSPISIKGPKGDDAIITASDVANWGFTKNEGTVTSVAVKMNGTTKGTVTSSGTIDLGTVLTDADASEFATHQDISGKANLDGGNTFTGKQILNSPGSDGYSINASGHIKGSWLQASSMANKGANTGKVCVFDNSGWIYYRTPAEILAEAGGATTSDVSGKLDKTTYEINKTINFGSSGVLYVGKFKVYDTNVTCEVTSTTTVTYSGKLVIATQNYVIKQMTVYGDAANTVAPNFFIKPSTTSDPYIEIYFKPASWSKNIIHIYGSEISAEPTNVCTNVSAVPSTATSKPTNALNSKANLDGANEFTDGTNTFRNIDGTTQISGSKVILKAIGVMGSASLSVKTDNNNEVFSVESDSESGVIHLNKTISLNGDMGTAGQALISQGVGATPQWKSMPTYSLSGTTLTITLP